MNKEEKLVRSWNLKRPSGTPVILTEDSGDETKTHTTSEAWVLGGHTAVIMVDCKVGGYMLKRIRYDDARERRFDYHE